MLPNQTIAQQVITVRLIQSESFNIFTKQMESDGTDVWLLANDK